MMAFQLRASNMGLMMPTCHATVVTTHAVPYSRHI